MENTISTHFWKEPSAMTRKRNANAGAAERERGRNANASGSRPRNANPKARPVVAAAGAYASPKTKKPCRVNPRTNVGALEQDWLQILRMCRYSLWFGLHPLSPVAVGAGLLLLPWLAPLPPDPVGAGEVLAPL